jgi:hypothetical protein
MAATYAFGFIRNQKRTTAELAQFRRISNLLEAEIPANYSGEQMSLQ